MKYYVDFKTGRGNQIVEGTLEEAIKVATENIAYTKENVCIYDYEEYKKFGNFIQPLAISYWVDTFPEEDEEQEEPIATFGSFGYYEPFVIL